MKQVINSSFHFFDHIFQAFHQKLYNRENIKHLMNLHFYSWAGWRTFERDMCKNNRDMFSTLTETFRKVLDKHASLETKRVRGNQSPFMTKELSKVVMNKSKTRNKYIKYLSRENFLAN